MGEPTIYWSKETYFKYKCVYKLKVSIWNKAYCVNINQKKMEVAILISARGNFRAREIMVNKEGY